jgi:hypothetical protein
MNFTKYIIICSHELQSPIDYKHKNRPKAVSRKQKTNGIIMSIELKYMCFRRHLPF